MLWFSFAVAILAATGIIWVGIRYLTNPKTMASSFGLPEPDGSVTTWWWLRLKGVRDLASGVLVLVFVAASGHRALGLVLLVEALIPLGDMSIVLAGKGRTQTALAVHGTTAAFMIAGAIPLLMIAR